MRNTLGEIAKTMGVHHFTVLQVLKAKGRKAGTLRAMMTDDLSITGTITVYRRVQPQYLSFDIRGDPVMSDGVFRTKELSLFRCDRVSELEVLDGYPSDGLVQLSIQTVHDAGCLVVSAEPPPGHICAYRKDAPGSRIGSGSAAKMARAARWIKLPARP